MSGHRIQGAPETAFQEGQHVKVTVDAVIQEAWQDYLGKWSYVIAFQAGRRRLLEFPADAESVTVEAVQP